MEGTSLQGVLRLTEDDHSAGMMVMAERQGMAMVPLCLPLRGSGGHQDTRPMQREAEDGMGTSVTPMLTATVSPNQTHASLAW